MEFEDVRQKVFQALDRFIRNEEYLLVNDAAERALVHRFAICIEYFFPGWNVDCEYNLKAIENDEILRKKSSYLHSHRKNGHIEKLELPEEVSINPDIIVHQRGPGPNLLVIEIKKNFNQEEMDFDIDKLRAYRNDPYLHYEYALFILFTSSPKNNWIDIEKTKWILEGEDNELLYCS
jgi:hypothetical protein